MGSGLLQEHNVEVVVFTEDVKGLPEQHRRITRHLESSMDELTRQAYAHRVWEQDRRLRPRLRIGPAAAKAV